MSLFQSINKGRNSSDFFEWMGAVQKRLSSDKTERLSQVKMASSGRNFSKSSRVPPLFYSAYKYLPTFINKSGSKTY